MNRHSKTLSHRKLKIGEKIRQLISIILIREDINFQISKNKVISITDVDISPDFKNAKVFVSTLNEEDKSNIIDNLNKKKFFFHKKLFKELNLKFLPNIKFYSDTSAEYSQKIDKILNQLNLRKN